MLLTVHHELVFESPPKLAQEIGAALERARRAHPLEPVDDLEPIAVANNGSALS